jgi:glycosyltransferase involved in cell wall biosynthesis
MEREKITAIVPTFNNERIIQRCLESVKWADEILVVDSFSTDKTLDICREFGARIIQHEYINSALQKNWAIPQASHEWILLLDSDEELEQGFAEEILNKLESAPDNIDGYRCSRRNLIYGKWVKTCGYYPDYQERLFRKKCRYIEREVHARVNIAPERRGQLNHDIIHHDMPDLQKYWAKFPRYMKYELDQLIKEGRRFRLREITLRPLYMFCWSYFYKQGFRDGIRGFLLSVLLAYYNFIMYMKLWEQQYGKNEIESWGKRKGFEKDK